MNESITSRQNPRIKLAAKLRDRRGRREQQRIIIDGIREIGRALDAGVHIIEAFVCEANVNKEGRELRRRLAETECQIVLVNHPVLAKIAFGDRSDGIVAVAKTPHTELSSLEIQEEMLVVVLENIEKPGNIGAVLRSADAAGISAMIVANAGTDLFNPNSIRASAGTIFSMPLVACACKDALFWVRQHGFQVFATRVDGAVDYTSVSYSGHTAIVLGSEAQGLSSSWQGADVTSVKLPMRGIGDSLNVSATAAVLFYEALRQRVDRETSGRNRAIP